MISGLLKLWMSSKAPSMDMDPPLPCPMKPIMIYSSMPVLLKIPVLYSSRSPALRGSSTLLGYPVLLS